MFSGLEKYAPFFHGGGFDILLLSDNIDLVVEAILKRAE